MICESCDALQATHDLFGMYEPVRRIGGVHICYICRECLRDNPCDDDEKAYPLYSDLNPMWDEP